MNKMNKKGFTLIEMLVVIAIIAILVAIIIPTVLASTTKAKAGTDAANLRSVIAEAYINVMSDSNYVYPADGVLDTKYYDESIKCKTDPSLNLKVIIDENNNVSAYFTNGSKTLTLDDLAATAGTGSTVTKG